MVEFPVKSWRQNHSRKTDGRCGPGDEARSHFQSKVVLQTLANVQKLKCVQDNKCPANESHQYFLVCDHGSFSLSLLVLGALKSCV
jgi:hypothetical protein